MTSPPPDLLVLGAGYVGLHVAQLARARGMQVLTTARSEARAQALHNLGFAVLRRNALDPSIGAAIDAQTHVVVSFPPDATTDALIAPALRKARAITYVSSTGVYGELAGHIDDSTEPPPPDARASRLLTAEACYRAQGATVLRCPGIYGPDRGLHARVLRGEHRIPGDGTTSLSRIHVEDLATLLLAAATVKHETFVVGDLTPEAHANVVRYICEAYAVPLPEQVSLDQVHPSLRADRRVDPTRALRVLGVTLRYPSYREGMAPAATGIEPTR